MSHINDYFSLVARVSNGLDFDEIEKLVLELCHLRQNKGRLFFLGVGGSAANGSHAVNDFRKLCGIESYSPADNVSELTARINDEGWEDAFVGWLKVSNFSDQDAIFVLSVGGGDREKNVSTNLIAAMDYALKIGAKIFALVGRDGGYAKKIGDNVILIPNYQDQLVTPISESFQAVIWHCLVSHPQLKINSTKW